MRVPTGSLFCLDRDLSIHRRVQQLIISNALCWSLDGATMYHADTIRRTVWAWDFHDDGSISNQRVFAQGEALGGPPDGAVVDAEGFLWIAHFGVWTIGRYDPSGRQVRSITLPVQNPTCPGFGGDGLSTLYVTSAKLGLSEEQLAGQPLAGGLFALDVGVAGRPEFRFSTSSLAR
jgi:sugar lactone lactonase YvrE